MSDFVQKIKELNLAVPVVSAIIERTNKGEKEILLQTRWKPGVDLVYTGTLEIPAGKIESYEDVYQAIKREVKKETGLSITKFTPEIKTKIFSSQKDGAFAFVPFCCQQQLKNGLPLIGFVFICEARGKIKAAKSEARAPFWIKVTALRKIVKESPKKIFTLQLPALAYYLERSDD